MAYEYTYQHSYSRVHVTQRDKCPGRFLTNQGISGEIVMFYDLDTLETCT